jgi:hypothetical protein
MSAGRCRPPSVDRLIWERTTGFEPATLTLAKKGEEDYRSRPLEPLEGRTAAEQRLTDIGLLGIKQLTASRDVGRDQTEPVVVGQFGVPVTDWDKRIRHREESESDHRPRWSMNRAASSSSSASESLSFTA